MNEASTHPRTRMPTSEPTSLPELVNSPPGDERVWRRRTRGCICRARALELLSSPSCCRSRAAVFPELLPIASCRFPELPLFRTGARRFLPQGYGWVGAVSLERALAHYPSGG